MNVTRDVVVDLWPLVQSGEASADSKRLVEEYLARDPALARELREETPLPALEPVPLALQPDHEMQTFKKARRRIVIVNADLFFAILFSCFAFGRIVSDTSFDVSPKAFIVTAAIAAVCWIVFFVRLVFRLGRFRLER